jgi:hypothetical protein
MMRAYPSTIIGALGALSLATIGCSGETTAPDLGPSTFHVEVTSVNGSTMLPTADMPLPANRGDKIETWGFKIEARKPTGEPDPTFNSYVRLSVKPGAILTVTGTGASGRNMLLANGEAEGTVDVTAVYGPTSLWAEDLGYKPTPAGRKDPPACSNGKDDDGDGLIDFPADPGCAFADDDDENGGTFAAGISPPVQYALPKVSDVRGSGSGTPYPYEAIEVNTSAPQRVVVTRVASDGFYVTDVNPQEVANGYNSVFAFNFSTPAGLRVCDIVTYLSGTANDFFGFTELNFPSYQVSFPIQGQGMCEVPEPTVIDGTTLANPVAMNKLQSALVRIQGFHIASHFGPGLMKNNVSSEDASSCDFNGDGQVDFTDPVEGSCSMVCDADPECSEWTAFSARGDVKVSKGSAATMIKINTGTVAGFDPTSNRGEVLGSVTGTLRYFSGGTLNWTIETRCPDDLACSQLGCGASQPVSSQTACVRLRTVDDNDQGTN